MSDKNHTVSESADKIVLTTNIKRGTDTRNEDKIRVKVKGDNPENAAGKLKATLDALEENGVSDQLRETQPGEDE